MGANGTPSGPSTSFSSASMLRASSAGDVGGDDIDSDDDDDGGGDEEEGEPAYAMPTSSTNTVVDVDSSWEVVADGDHGDDGILAPPHSPAPVVGKGRRRAVAWAWKESQYGGEVRREESIVIDDDRRRRRHRGVVVLPIFPREGRGKVGGKKWRERKKVTQPALLFTSFAPFFPP